MGGTISDAVFEGQYYMRCVVRVHFPTVAPTAPFLVFISYVTSEHYTHYVFVFDQFAHVRFLCDRAVSRFHYHLRS